MTKEEMIAALKASKLQESNATNVKKAEDTLQNIEAKEVKEAPKADGIKGLDSELPTQKEVEKEVAKNEGPIVPADKDGVSKNGGECDKMEDGKVEAEKKKEDNGMKDVINVSDRKVEEAAEVHNELLAQLKEASAREDAYKAKIESINALCKRALKAQAEQLTKNHANEMNKVFESVIAEGEQMEKALTEAAAKNAKMYKTAQKLYESSAKLNGVLLEAVRKSIPAKKMTRYMTPQRRAALSVSK